MQYFDIGIIRVTSLVYAYINRIDRVTRDIIIHLTLLLLTKHLYIFKETKYSAFYGEYVK